VRHVAIGSGPYEPLPPPSDATVRAREVLASIAAAVDLLGAGALPLRVARRDQTWSAKLGAVAFDLLPDDDEVHVVAAACGLDPSTLADARYPADYGTDLVGSAADACRVLGGGWDGLGDELGVTDPTLEVDADGELGVTLSAGGHAVQVRFTVPRPDGDVLQGLAHDLRDPCIDARREGRAIDQRW
jgi:hypothetical protein